jgi:vacuolar-type H+-ATPase subunit I/STV1
MYFKIFNIKPKFIFESEDIKALEDNFLTLQKESYNQGDVINLQSKNLNIAYETLSKEGKRLKYILQSLGIEIEEIKMNPELTEYIFELREDISDCETESELNSKIHDVEIELREVRDMIENEVQKGINGKVDTRTLCELFCKFKCLKEVIKSHKKQAV